MKMTEEATSPLYDLWSKFYDYTFGALVRKRQALAIQQLRTEPGQIVLDLGVGTGMTLRHYPKNVTVVGMDLSPGMLAKAKDKVAKDRLDHCVLIQGDAMMPPFAEQSFDHIMITHVVSVVSDPQKLMMWARRLVKPGGRIVVLNHFRSPNPFIGWWERVLNPIFVKIGWRSDLALEDCLADTGLNVQYQFKPGRADLWQIVVLGSERDTALSVKCSPSKSSRVLHDGASGKSHAALVME